MEEPDDKVEITIADLTITARFMDDKWEGKCKDTFHKHSHYFSLSPEDFGTLLCAFVQGVDTGWLYVAAAKIVENWPQECRPIP